MSQTTPPTITSAPAVPVRGTSTFKTLVDAFLTWMALAVTQFGALAANVYSNALDAYGSAVSAAASALASLNSAASASMSATIALSMANAPAYADTSTSSLAIGTGSKVFTVASGKSWGAGMALTAQATTGNSMAGTVTSYSGTTLTLNVTSVTGSGTFSSWAIALAAPKLGLVRLAVFTPTVAAAVNVLTVVSPEYDSYLIVGKGIRVSANDNLFMRLAVAGALDSGTNYYDSIPFSITPKTGAVSQIPVTSDPVGSAGKGINFSIRIFNANDSSFLKSVICEENHENATANNFVTSYRGLAYTAANAITGFGLFWQSASNFAASGTITVYGIQN